MQSSCLHQANCSPRYTPQLKLGQYDAPSLLSACIAYNVAAYKGRVANVCIVDAAERAKAMNALVEWSAAISTDDNNMLLNIFGPMDAERAEIEAQLELNSAMISNCCLYMALTNRHNRAAARCIDARQHTNPALATSDAL